MKVTVNGIQAYCLPDCACCTASDTRQSPLDLDECPLFHEECNTACIHYAEDLEEKNNGRDRNDTR